MKYWEVRTDQTSVEHRHARCAACQSNWWFKSNWSNNTEPSSSYLLGSQYVKPVTRLATWLKHSYSNVQNLSIPSIETGWMSAVLQWSSRLVRINNILNNCLPVVCLCPVLSTNPTSRRSHSAPYLFDALSPFICRPSSMPIPNPATSTLTVKNSYTPASPISYQNPVFRP